MDLKSRLESHSISTLRKEISKTNIKGYSKMKKAEVVALMLKHSDRFNHIQQREKVARKAPAPRKAPEPKKAEVKKKVIKKPEPKEEPKKVKKIIKKSENNDAEIKKLGKLTTKRFHEVRKYLDSVRPILRYYPAYNEKSKRRTVQQELTFNALENQLVKDIADADRAVDAKNLEKLKMSYEEIDDFPEHIDGNLNTAKQVKKYVLSHQKKIEKRRKEGKNTFKVEFKENDGRFEEVIIHTLNIVFPNSNTAIDKINKRSAEVVAKKNKKAADKRDKIFNDFLKRIGSNKRL